MVPDVLIRRFLTALGMTPFPLKWVEGVTKVQNLNTGHGKEIPKRTAKH